MLCSGKDVISEKLFIFRLVSGELEIPQESDEGVGSSFEMFFSPLLRWCPRLRWPLEEGLRDDFSCMSPGVQWVLPKGHSSDTSAVAWRRFSRTSRGEYNLRVRRGILFELDSDSSLASVSNRSLVGMSRCQGEGFMPPQADPEVLKTTFNSNKARDSDYLTQLM